MVKKIFWGICLTVSILLMAVTVRLGFYAKQRGILSLTTSGNPKETVRQFYDAVLAGDYENAYTYLLDYNSLGFVDAESLEAEDLPAGSWEQFRNVLLESYAYTLEGEPVVQDLNASQKVRFTCFCTELLRNEMNERYYELLKERVQTRPRPEVYDKDGNYRVDLLEELYVETLKEFLQDSEKYLRTTEYTVELRYQDKEWKILVNDKMTEGFVGNIR